jgi:hypothetical protein
MPRQTPLSEIKELCDEQLLVSRDHVRVMLGISYHQVVLLEEAGTLQAIRLMPGPKAKAYYRRADIIALTEKYSKPQSNELKAKKRA